MIAEQIQAALASTGIPSYQLIAAQDEQLPFYVFGIESTPVRTKDGIAFHSSQVVVYCCSDKVGHVVTLGNDAIQAIEAITGGDADVFSSQYKSRNTDSSMEDGKEPVYIETVQFIVKHSIV